VMFFLKNFHHDKFIYLRIHGLGFSCTEHIVMVIGKKNFLYLCKNFVFLTSLLLCLISDIKKQIILDGPRSCGKSIALAMLVHWARTEGWLVFYVPQGKDWTYGGFFYRNTYNDFFDTPVQASKIMQVMSSI
jgi:small subunit ribosomal protein S29